MARQFTGLTRASFSLAWILLISGCSWQRSCADCEAPGLRHCLLHERCGCGLVPEHLKNPWRCVPCDDLWDNFCADKAARCGRPCSECAGGEASPYGEGSVIFPTLPPTQPAPYIQPAPLPEAHPAAPPRVYDPAPVPRQALPVPTPAPTVPTPAVPRPLGPPVNAVPEPVPPPVDDAPLPPEALLPPAPPGVKRAPGAAAAEDPPAGIQEQIEVAPPTLQTAPVVELPGSTEESTQEAPAESPALSAPINELPTIEKSQYQEPPALTAPAQVRRSSRRKHR